MHRVHGQEQVTLIAIELGPLMLVHGVFDRQRVQAEFLAEHGEVIPVWVVQVKPDDCGLVLGQVVADVVDGKALGHHLAVPVRTSPGLAPGRCRVADRCGGSRRGVVAAKCHPACGAHVISP